MKSLRTPDDRFANLADYPFAPNYVEISDLDGGKLRVHYLDEGPRDGDIVLLMHGEPSWSYLYRKMIPILVAAGHRVIAPDLVGFGKSDKPTEMTDYSYSRHVQWMAELLFDHLTIRKTTFFGQDWGGLVGLRLVAAEPERFSRIVVSNTGLPTGEHPPTDAFIAWRDFSQNSKVFPIGTIVNGGSATDLSEATVAAYDAPFPDDSYKAGARIFPSFVPTSVSDPASNDNIAAWEILKKFERPVLCCFGDKDPVSKGGEKPFMKLIPGAQGQPHVTIEGGGHFVQEDKGEEVAALINSFIASTPL